MLFDKSMLGDAMENLKSNYHKILLINLTDDTFKPITISDDEWSELDVYNIRSVSGYFDWFAHSDLIHDDDRDNFIEFGKSLQPNSHTLYRRNFNGVWHWVLLEVIPAKDYADNNKSCILYVRDFNDIYALEYENVAERIGMTDSMTGLYNKVALERDQKKHINDSVGIIFCDLNALKYTNDHFGHRAGDELILKLANLLTINFNEYSCYHICGDEFVVCAFGASLHKFLRKAIAFHKSLWINAQPPITSLGYSIGGPGEFQMAYREAEKEMYDDKRLFYTRFPEYKREDYTAQRDA
jgi:diguanylate cyclase (GGDEF)-like protein